MRYAFWRTKGQSWWKNCLLLETEKAKDFLSRLQFLLWGFWLGMSEVNTLGSQIQFRIYGRSLNLRSNKRRGYFLFLTWEEMMWRWK